MITLAAWTAEDGSVSLVRGDFGHPMIYVDGTFDRVHGATHTSDEAAIERATRSLRQGAFGLDRRDYVREF